MENKEDLKKIIKDVFESTPKQNEERKIKFASYCKGVNGAKFYSSDDMQLCSHPECNNCRRFEQIFKEEFNKILK